MTAPLRILGIESTCDDTAAAVVQSGVAETRILSSVVVGQDSLHSAFGGVVPEIAARAHSERLEGVAIRALDEAGLALSDIDAIAVSAGPGLIGGVLSGVMFAKGLAAGAGLPILAVNHLAGHALTPRLTDDLPFPYLILLISGGHCQFLITEAHDRFTRLGGTIDDAPGEAFDKTARILGLPQPGGPVIEAAAKAGNPNAHRFPRPLLDREGVDLSFSGLKTAVLRARDASLIDGTLPRQVVADIAASFQAAVAEVLVEKSRRALDTYLSLKPAHPAFAVAGGVAANQAIRAGLETAAKEAGARFIAPPLPLCTDNAAMIAWAGLEAFQHGHRDDLTFAARPRWPLDTKAAAMLGSGKKGPKA